MSIHPIDPSRDAAEPVELSRRGFLATSAGLLGAGALLSAAGCQPGSSSAADDWAAPIAKAGPRVQPDQPIRMAVIGTGGMGTGHCEAFCSINEKGKDKVQIVAVSDVCKSHLDRAHKKCADKQKIEVAKYGSYKELLARDDIHAVLIASPEHWHGQMAIDAVAAGKDVYCEKPMTLHLDEAVRLRKTVLANPSTIFQVGTQMMQVPKFHEARKLIKSGAIGKAVWSQTSYCRNSKDGEWNYYAIDKNWKPGENLDWEAWCGPSGPAKWDPLVYARWRRYRKYSTGIIGDLLVHVMTPLMLALDQGWPVRVTSLATHAVDEKMENHDQINITVEFETGHIMVVAGSTANEVGLETLIRGHKGNIYLGSNNCVVRPERIYSEESDEKTIKCEDIGNDQDVHRLAWLRCIRTREHPPADVDLSTKVMVVVDLATRSAWDGRTWRFDPATMRATAV